MNKPLISVMIPTWNPNPSYLKQTIESVLIQDLGPNMMQIAVVDDCSSKLDVHKLLQDWGFEHRIEWYQNEYNLGIGGGWNSCITHARGEWVHILHQDDVLDEGFYNILNLSMVKENKEKIGFVLTRNTYLNQENNKKTFSKLVYPTVTLSENFHLIMHEVDMQCPGIIVPKSVYDKLGLFKEEFKYSLDREMWTRIATKYSILYNPEPLCYFRVHNESQSARLQSEHKNIKEYSVALDSILAHFNQQDRGKIEPVMRANSIRSLVKSSKSVEIKEKIELLKLAWINGNKWVFLKALLS